MTPWRSWPGALLLAASLAAAPAAGQVPDTLVADTAVAEPRVPADTVPADTLPVADLARLPVAPPPGWHTGVWAWDRDALLGVRDLTLLELLESVPGIVPLRGGDYGAPEAASALAMGGGRLRVFWDGFETIPLDGGVPDLALVGLAGVEEVRVERGPGELRVYVESVRAREPEAMSLVEAGTGDLATNFFRGTFVHPRVLGGILGLALERVDTRGPFGRERGSRVGGWVSWGRPIGDHVGVRVEGRRTNRNVGVAAFPVGLSRTDWVARGRGRFLEDRLTAEVFTGSSSLDGGEEEGIVPLHRSRRQHGLRVAWEPGPAWAAGTVRLFGGAELPSRSVELEGGGSVPGLGGVHGRLGVDVWDGTSTTALTLHGWTAPFFGLSGFATYGGGARGMAIYPAYVPLPEEGDPPPVPEPTHGFTDHTTLRIGGAFRRPPLSLEGAWISLEADRLPPTGLVLDRAGLVEPGGTFTGWEGRASVDLPRVDGFTVSGFVQSWDREARYLPLRLYQAAVDFHDVFLETGNLEVWGAVGVRGRDPMLVPPFEAPEEELPALVRVPFYQSWYVDLQIRVVTVHVFIRWENLTIRQNLQDFPDRRLPPTRAVYGVRWTLWN